jgi:hypothetical protein
MCGRKRKASTLERNWQGLYRCPEHNEPRQPQDFVRAIPDIVTPSWVQDETDINIQICTFNGISAIPGLAIPGCSMPGNNVFDMNFYPFTIQIATDAGAGLQTDAGQQLGGSP